MEWIWSGLITELLDQARHLNTPQTCLRFPTENAISAEGEPAPWNAILTEQDTATTRNMILHMGDTLDIQPPLAGHYVWS